MLENERNFRDLIENLPDGVIIADEQGRHLFANSRAAEITGYTVDELQNITIKEMTLPEELEKYKQRCQNRIEGEPLPRPYEHRIVRKDGTTVLTELTTTTTVWQGQVCSMVIIHDITERKLTEERIRQEREALALINALNHAANRGDSLHEIIELFDHQAKGVFSVNDATVYLLNEDKEYLVLQNLTLPLNLTRRIEKLIGRDIPKVRIRLSAGSVYAEILKAGKPQITDDPAMIQQMMAECTESKILQKLIPAISRILNYRSVMSVPLVIDGEALGLVDMSCQELFSESDLERFVAVAEQFTAILRRKRTEEALHRSLEKIAHGQRLLLALGQADQAVQRARTPEAVYRAIGEQAAGLGFETTVFSLSDDRAHLIVSHLTIKSDLVRAAEKLTGLSAKGYRFPLTPDGFFQQIIAGGETVFSHLDVAPIAEALPRQARPLAERLMGSLSWKQSIIAPLTIGGEVQSLLSVTGADLTESDVPAVTAFANQAAIAIENARLYKETQQLAAFNESIIQNMAEGITIENAEGHFTFVNPAAATSLGYTSDELVGLHWTAIIPPDQQPLVQAADERRMRGEADIYELELLRQDGGRISVLVGGSPRFDAEGRFTGTMAVFTDITERKQAEEALKESEDRYRAVVESSHEGILVVEADYKFNYVNDMLCEMLGRRREEIIDHDFREFLDEDGKKLVGDRYVKRQRGKDVPPRYEFNIVRKNGEKRRVEISSTIVRDPTDRTWTISQILDITDRKRAEEAREQLTAQVREQARRVTQVLATVPAGVLLLNSEGRVLQANPAAENALAALTGAKVGEDVTHFGDRPLAELLTSPPTKGLRHEVKADNRTFEVIARPIENGPEPEYWVLVVNDVTQEREIREQLQQQERLAAVGQLAAGIAHDFNNILAVIVLYTEMALNTPGLPSKIRERLEIISQETAQATKLIQQILDFSRRAVLERRPMALTPFLKEVIELLERTIPESIKLSLSYGRDEYTVNADPTRMQQAILNLVVNARDAMLPQGGGELRITLSRTTATDEIRCVTCGQIVGGEWVRITVTDAGSGIPPDVLPHIFEPFFTTKEIGKGTGLGLAQVYGIVEQHEGHIDVTTTVGEGTTFTLYLPALLTQPSADAAKETQTHIQGQGETILVVEDDATLRAALVDSVELLNYRALKAVNGREALDILEQHAGEVSLVLSDLVMPKMGGQALFHALKQRGLTLPMVILSGHPLENELEDLQAQGLAGWMLKPLDLKQLSQLLARTLGEKSE